MKESNKRENLGWAVKHFPETSMSPLYWEDELSEEESLLYRRDYTREIVDNRREN